MSDLISRSELLKRFPVKLDSPFWHVNGIRAAINALDAVRVEQARWIEAAPGKHIGMKCSYCKARIKYSEYNSGNHKFCHKCGAFMGGDQRE